MAPRRASGDLAPASSSIQDDVLISTDFQPRLRRGTSVSTTDSPFSFTSLAPPSARVVQEAQKLELVLQDKVVAGGSATRDLFAGHAAHVRNDPIEFSKQLSLWASGTGWRSYTEYIGGRIMYEGYSLKQIKAITESPQVTAKIRQLSEERLEALHLPPEVDRQEKLASLERQLREVVLEVADGLVAKMDSVRFLRFFGASVNNILVRMYDQGIHISLPEYAAFREVAVEAAKRKQSLLILPCHKSHIDYLTMSWLFFRCGLSLPHIVAGANLNMPILGSWLQKCGAFFIRRSFGDDALYPVVVKEYIEQLVEQGMNIECFIEGGRSRTGKLLPPKLGILKYVVEALQNGRTDDVWIAPVSVQYDKVIETESYVNELLGNPKEKETLTGLLLNTRVIQLQLGRIDVRFKKPYSLKEWLNKQTDRREIKLSTSTNPPLDRRTEQAKLLRALGYQVLADINSAAVIMPAGLVGAVMLTIRGRGVGKQELVERVGWLRSTIEARGGRVADFAGMDLESVVDRALVVLKDLIGEHKGLIEPTYYPANRFELSFYRNQVIHLFVSESMLCAALYTHVKAGGAAPSQRMPTKDVLAELHFLSRLLQHEFVYGTEGLEANAAATIAQLERDEVILIEGDLLGLSPKERASGRNNYDFYCFLLWPFIETYWLAAVSLFALTPLEAPPNSTDNVAWFAEKEFHKSAQLLGKNAHFQGDISYLEAINQATLANAFQRIVDLGVIITRRSSPSAGKSIPIMALHPKWVPERLPNGQIAPHGRLWDFLSHLGAFRREGKNRRDSATVSTRMFRHCSAIAPPIVEWGPFTATEALSDFWKTKPQL
ncbi:acyltransferase-domain-containing protein [Leucosporidium creatinivorum]|uniref:Acyltransferase-domain-containing protein n=1 Tax=Leucosporidium creatinivorum TaxID=106004 RepID=A0A1Y2G004_9BASI|nr:acyltransferase-domain-containing protein [Leucosporidium creatinivorum]